ncbi:carbohydrate-binding family 9-like protein [Sunxiuqinia sp. A32]|uniref:carbohydrate-binding family 9-like protein n=1 Tax=Sunxiuqinia sp. A32 TaxID=3461496 RepID=UPI004045AB84
MIIIAPSKVVSDKNPMDWLDVFSELKSNKIGFSPWNTNEQIPIVSFKIAHTTDDVLLQFSVSEDEILAKYSNHQEPVYKDSCVEFFISFEGDENYYNLEFNCLGTCLAAYGRNRNNRTSLPINLIKEIRSSTNINRQKELFNWSLSLRIPSKIFAYNQIAKLSGLKVNSNFYKCGDDLSKPHFLCWNNIETNEPDFHQPGFFGEIAFS